MQILVVGLNHKAAPVEVREKLAFGDGQLGDAICMLLQPATEGVILSTCNRMEIYAVVGHAASGTDNVKRFLADFHDVSAEEFEPYLYVHCQEHAVRHLFSVASGIDSMILGEPQILGQVRDAFEFAEKSRSVGRLLSPLFRQAISVGKLARTETDISRNAASVSYAAVELAKKIFGNLDHRTVLIIGAGEMGKLTARTLLDNGASSMLVMNRTFQRAQDLAARFGGNPIEFEKMAEALALADIVITSTGAPEYIIRADEVKQAMRQRRNRPVFFVDIAVPRDIDPQVDKIENAYLYNIDDLQAVCEANMREREKEARKVEAIVEAEAAKYMSWYHTLDVVPTITALYGKAEAIRQAELARMMPKLGNLSERDREKINALTVAIVNKLLHQPITRLKSHSNGHSSDEYARALRELFDLTDKA
ncbi:MAG: glutamyl-tRNA reductase [Chloroflexi bacterium]|nr:glutamyl-tRNA reductase [Chloroflexota bacterium]MDA8188214.1 glutamyl-tRNA reductase [Dehalococcoidales bacterium]